MCQLAGYRRVDLLICDMNIISHLTINNKQLLNLLLSLHLNLPFEFLTLFIELVLDLALDLNPVQLTIETIKLWSCNTS